MREGEGGISKHFSALANLLYHSQRVVIILYLCRSMKASESAVAYTRGL